MKKVEVRLTRGPGDELVVGELAQRGRRTFVEYSRAFLETGLDLSPWKLPAQAGLVEHTDLAFGEVPGLFADSLPDGWGLLLMDRHVRKEGGDPATLTALDRLSDLGTRTMDALTYHPPAEAPQDPLVLDLHRLAVGARRVLAGPDAEVLPELLRAGGSPGGARPKVLVGVNGDQLLSGEDDLPPGFEHWLVKFSATSDGADGGRVELAYAKLAAAAGVDVPPVRLFETRDKGAYFGVRRFDRRPGNRRLHAHSLGGLLHANFRLPNCDYDHLFKVARGLTHDHRALVECFRRMVFNVAAHNRDDHVKNFAFLLDDAGTWSLSPAYDVVYSHGPGGEHQMTIAGEGGAPTRADCLTLADRHGISRGDAAQVLEQVNDAVATWREVAMAAGCRATTVREIACTHRAL